MQSCASFLSEMVHEVACYFSQHYFLLTMFGLSHTRGSAYSPVINVCSARSLRRRHWSSSDSEETGFSGVAAETVIDSANLRNAFAR